MMKIKILAVAFFFFPIFGIAQKNIQISKDIYAEKLSDNVYLYVSAAEIRGFGNVLSNGLIIVNKAKAFLIDTPINNEQTEILTTWVRDSLRVEIAGFVPGHWHDDCMGGLSYLQKEGIESYANQMTIDMAKQKKLPVPKHGFIESLTVWLGDLNIECYYLGGGHTADNIVVWIPSEKILFGGCLVKDLQAKNLGNTADAVLEEWPETIKQVKDKFPHVKYIIPGHGNIGGTELLEHTLRLLDTPEK